MSTATMERTAVMEEQSRGGKYLSFFLDREEYGIEILRVREIIGLMPITAVPRTPPYICGVINLRGKVIPIIDLRMKFQMPPIDATDETCIIVVQSGEHFVGTVVDKVSEVMDISDEDVVDAPSLGSDINTDYILGIGKAEGRVKLLLDIERVLSTPDTAALHALTSESVEDRQ